MSEIQSPARRRICAGVALAVLDIGFGACSARAAALTERADRILVLKSARQLLLMRANDVMARYPVALGAQPTGHKRQQGDKRTPEGRYRVDMLNPYSRYHRALHISYPNSADLRQARAAGIAPGGDVEIHGLPRGFETYDPAVFTKDWTDGCIAVSNRAMDEIWDKVRLDTPVEIIP